LHTPTMYEKQKTGTNKKKQAVFGLRKGNSYPQLFYFVQRGS
jgi:hypothetical protein